MESVILTGSFCLQIFYDSHCANKEVAEVVLIAFKINNTWIQVHLLHSISDAVCSFTCSLSSLVLTIITSYN